MAGSRAATYPQAPQYLGLALIASLGILALIISIWQYRWGRSLHCGRPVLRYWRGWRWCERAADDSPVIAIAIFLTCIGLFAFFAVSLRQV